MLIINNIAFPEEEDVEEEVWLGGNEELQDVLGST